MSKKKCYHPQSFLFYTIGDLMFESETNLDENTEIVKQCVDKLNETVADFYFGENEDKFKDADLGPLMSATVFTFFIMGVKKMNAGIKKGLPPGSYLEFIKEKVNVSLDKAIQEAKDDKED